MQRPCWAGWRCLFLCPPRLRPGRPHQGGRSGHEALAPLQRVAQTLNPGLSVETAVCDAATVSDSKG